MNISLIVPTKNRPLYVERLLKYYSDLNFTGYIFVLDSSEKKISKDIRNFVKRTKNKKIQYFRDVGFPGIITKKYISKVRRCNEFEKLQSERKY